MTCSIINLTTLSALLIATLTPQTQASNGCSRRVSYPPGRVVRPVIIVRPMLQPTVVPVAITLPEPMPTPSPRSRQSLYPRIKRVATPQVSTLIPGAPFVFPQTATLGAATRPVMVPTALSPIVLPTAALTRAAAPSVATEMRGQGTPDQPFVLPPVQSATTSAEVAPPSEQPASEQEEEWLRTNPFLHPLQDAPAAETPIDETSVESPIERAESTADRASTGRSLTSTLSDLARALLSK